MAADNGKDKRLKAAIKRSVSRTFTFSYNVEEATKVTTRLRASSLEEFKAHQEQVAQLRNAVYHDLKVKNAQKLELEREGKDLPPDLVADLRALNQSHSSLIEVELVHEQPKVRIARVPGHGLLRVLGHFSPKQFRELLLEPRFADMSRDYADQVARGDHTRARMMRVAIPLQLLWIALHGALGGVLLGALQAFRKPSQGGADE